MSFQRNYGVKRLNNVLAKDRHKVRLSKFDESDPKQHIEKCLVGCGTYFCFRGEGEHASLLVEQVVIGYYEPEHEFTGKQFVSIGHLVKDKKKKLDANNSWVRDTTNIMRIPIFDTDDNPNTDDFGASLKRLKQKATPGQKRLYCYWNEKNGEFHAQKPIGRNTIRQYHKDAAKRLGIDEDSFRGGHAWRSFAITTMVNDPSVSNAESMLASRHKSMSAQLPYQLTDIISEGNRMKSLLHANGASHCHVPGKSVEVVPSTSKNSSVNMISSSPIFTQQELQALEEDLVTDLDEPLSPKHDFDIHEEDNSDFTHSYGPMDTQQEFEALETDLASTLEYPSTSGATYGTMQSQTISETGSSYFNQITNPYKKPNFTNPKRKPAVTNPYEKKKSPVPNVQKAQPLSQSSSSQGLVDRARELVASASTMQGQFLQKKKVMSDRQAEIRRLIVQLQDEKRQKLTAQRILRAAQEEHRLDVDDLETRLTDLQQDYEFNHKQGTWYRHGRNSTRRFY